MVRSVLRILLALMVVAVLVIPVLARQVSGSASSGIDPVTITEYAADYRVDEDGTLHAREEITADFPALRHGIFRYWDLADFNDDSVRYRPRDIEVTLNGGPVENAMLWENGRRFRVAKIGDPNSYVDAGSNTYVITYTIDGVLGPGGTMDAESGSSWADESSGHTEFVWHVVAAGWSMRINEADITVELPRPAEGVRCRVDGLEDCQITGAGTTTLQIAASNLGPNTPVVVGALLDGPAPDRAGLPWSVAFDTTLGGSVLWLAIAVGLGLIGLAVGWWWDRSSHERTPGLPVMFEPPAGLGPVQTVWIAEERVPSNSIVASLLHASERGLVTLEERQDRTWTVTGKAEKSAWDDVDEVTRFVGSRLGVTEPGQTFRASHTEAAGQKLSHVKTSLPGIARAWGTRDGATESSAHELAGRVVVIIALVVSAAVAFITVAANLPVIWMLPFAGFAIGGVGLFSHGVGSRRTEAGRRLWSHAGGFHRFLSTNSAKDRFDFSGREGLFLAYIPYAVAFDCATEWAEKYEVATGAAAPWPVGYVPLHASDRNYAAGNSFAGFESAISSSISTYTAAQSSSSSGGGFSGGGFSGGGGGGGGGGSW